MISGYSKQKLILIFILVLLVGLIGYWLFTNLPQIKKPAPSSLKLSSKLPNVDRPYTPEEEARLKDTSLPESARAIVPQLDSEEITGKIEKIGVDSLIISGQTYPLSDRANFALIKGGNPSMSNQEISDKEVYVAKEELKVGDSVKATYVANLQKPGLLFIKIFK